MPFRSDRRNGHLDKRLGQVIGPFAGDVRPGAKIKAGMQETEYVSVSSKLESCCAGIASPRDYRKKA